MDKTFGLILSKFGLCLWLLLMALPSMAGVYKWVDAQGKTHYGDAPPLSGKAKEVNVKENTIHVAPVDTSGLTSTSAAKSYAKVTIYTASWCGYCKRAKALLAQRGVGYAEYDIETSAQGRRDYEKINGHGVPITFIGKTRIDGFDAGSFNAALAAAGY